jgi:hypothetical protein
MSEGKIAEGLDRTLSVQADDRPPEISPPFDPTLNKGNSSDSAGSRLKHASRRF